MNKPTIKECFADNGEHSHWELIDSDTGEVLWKEEELPFGHCKISDKSFNLVAKRYWDAILEKADDSDCIKFIGEKVIDIDDLKEILETPIEKEEWIEFKSIKSISQGDELCFDDFRNEKIVHIAKDKILFKTEIEEFRMTLSGHRTGKRYFAIVLDNGERIYCNETEFDKI